MMGVNAVMSEQEAAMHFAERGEFLGFIIELFGSVEGLG
jgi:hypothetical protein